MPNANAPRGLQVFGPLLGAKMYKIAAAYGTALFIGDPVARNNQGDIIIATAGAGNYVLGALLGLFDANFCPMATPHLVAATAGVHYGLVADDPMQLFCAMEDSVGNNLALTDLAANVDLIAGAGGSANTGLSGWMLDSSTAGAGATVQCRLIDYYRDPGLAIGQFMRWVVRITYHQGSPSAVGVGI